VLRGRPVRRLDRPVRALTREFGALLIFDEVKTGFRVARGGAAEYFGIEPDLACYAKAMGNGYPAAAFGGKAEIMSVMPKHMSHGGTYAGNRVAAAAAVATLETLKDGTVLADIAETGRRIQTGLSDVAARRGLPISFMGHPTMFGMVFAETPPADHRGWATTDHDL
jgi:glutamate-1-semialdehyde 2,1-aminomutase